MSHPKTEHFSSALTWAGVALLAWLLYLVVQPFLIPLGWACVIAVLIYPAFARLARRIGPGRAAALATVAAAIVLIAPAVALTNAFAREMVDIARTLQASFAEDRPSSIQSMWAQVSARVPFASRIDLGAIAPDALQRAAAFLMGQSGAILTNVAVFFVDLALSLFATFFLLRDADVIMRAVRTLLPMSFEAREAFITRTADLIAAGVTSSVIVAGLQGLLGGLSFAILGLSAPVFWGVIMGFVCLLPFGAGMIWLPAAIYLLATGSVTKGLILIGLGAGVVSMVDNVVRPLLLSGRVQMNGLVIFVSLLGGLNVFGVLGIVLGPIVVVTAISLVTSYIDSVAADDIVGP
ncbi:MAG TPA: AI-2E family transporter [Vicinamibacterales bacterium]|nr:AI-2E family transporter [Vicinamibacterales bacterium]